MNVQLFYKQHGAVSIFLVIILVPVIMVCSIFVDVSRLKLAQAQVSAAGDLAMNTLLTQYDTELNDFYGLMASSQSIEEFYDNVENYFTVSLVSQGIDADQAYTTSSDITSILRGDTDVSDFMQIALMEDTNLEVEPLPNGNLANPAMMRNQIVEFMKYRSPANAAITLMESLQDASDELEDAEENAQLMSDRQDYYQAENEVMQDAYDIYELLEEYESLGLTEEYISEMKSDLAEYESRYEEFHHTMIKDLYNTQGYGTFDKKTITTSVIVSTYYDDGEDGSNLASSANIGTLLDSTAKDLSEFISAAGKLQTDFDSISYDGAYGIQYWIHMVDCLDASGSYSNFVSKGNTLFSDYAKLQNAMNYPASGATESNYTLTAYSGVNTSGEKKLSEHYASLCSQINSTYTNYTNSTSTFTVLGNRLSTISSNATTSTSTEIDNSATSTAVTDSEIQEIYAEINGYYNKVCDAMDIISEIQDKLVTLKNDIDEWEGAYDNWEKDAGTYEETGNEMAEGDLAELDGIDRDMLQDVNNETIAELSNRFNNVNSLLGQIKAGIQDYKYQGTSICEIDSYSTMKSVSEIDESCIVVNNIQLDNYASDSFRFTASYQIDSYTNITNNNNPSMEVNKPLLYEWIINQFAGYEGDGTDDRYDDYLDQVDDTAQEAKEEENNGVSNEISDRDNLPSNRQPDVVETGDAIDSMSDDLGKTSEVVSGMFGGLTNTLQSMGEKVRDDLYTVDYVTSMFTYDTFEKEVANAEDRVTLTNKELNSTNNWSYQNEVEYILYGGTNGANKASAYGTIFLIRFALNLPADYEYCYRGEGSGPIEAIAYSISTATGGIIPAGLVKLAIYLAITVAESVADLNTLKDGKKVLLIKSVDDLVISFDGATNELVGSTEAGEEDTEEEGLTLSYCDYLKVLLFVKLLDEEKADQVYKRIADVIQVNMQQVGSHDDFQMANAKVYYRVTGQVEVSPLLLSWALLRNEEGNPYAEIDWRSFQYATVRGY
ncbi:MAG: DUF5702 domain-containing protein [Roseburia sp.]